MSAIFEAWTELSEEAERREPATKVAEQARSTVLQLADEQLVELVHRLFLAGWPKSMRQVVFAGTGEDAGCAGICRRIAETLADQSPARVCLLETDCKVHVSKAGGCAENQELEDGDWESLPREPVKLKRNLQLFPGSTWRSAQERATLPWMRRRLAELRSTFDYAVIHAPPIGVSSEPETLARLTDGMVLVVEAHRTRRVLARVTQKKLRSAGVQVLGAILSGRTFPIPERIYRRF